MSNYLNYFSLGLHTCPDLGHLILNNGCGSIDVVDSHQVFLSDPIRWKTTIDEERVHPSRTNLPLFGFIFSSSESKKKRQKKKSQLTSSGISDPLPIVGMIIPQLPVPIVLLMTPNL